MDIERIDYKELNETLYIYTHKSGLKAFVVPKKGYTKKYASFATYYGSINNKFIVPGEDTINSVPDGIAHFLEHKLFEQKDGNVMDKFSELGASPNAYTGFNQTVYLFSCTERFDESFKLLLNYVQNPYLTDENVEKEKGIIGQEINMYQDSPGWRSFFNLLQLFYKNNPVRIDIAGTIDSISKINKEILYKCYNTFYHPSNMVVLAVGDVDYNSVFEQVEASIVTNEKREDIKRIFPEESESLNGSYKEQALSVSMPIFQLGFKDNNKYSETEERIIYEITIKVLLNMLFGRSSEFYNKMYNEGLINSSFAFDFDNEINYSFSTIGGESQDPQKVKDNIITLIDSVKKKGLSEKDFDRILKATKGRFVRQFNSVERISRIFIPMYFKNYNIFDYYKAYDKITLGHTTEAFNKHFNPENLALSVIKPKTM
jgi:predicted Zn-dependent peptidase